MASRFKIVDEEYIKELKDKSENENRKNTARSGERTFTKSKFRRVRGRCPRPTIVAVFKSIQKFSNFALYVINK